MTGASKRLNETPPDEAGAARYENAHASPCGWGTVNSGVGGSLHIVYVAHAYKPAYRIGGPIWSISALAEGMVARGHRVTVFATNGNAEEDLDVPTDREVMVDGVGVWYFRRTEPIKHYLPWFKYVSQSIGYLYTPDLRPTMKSMLPSIDVVHTQMPFVYPTQAAARVALAGGRPLFYSQRGVFDPSRLRFRSWKKSLYIRLVERPIMRRATGLVALTPEEAESFRALGVRTPVHLIPNGINVEQFRRVASPGSVLDLGISDSDQVILFLARVHETKGPDVAVDAFIRIAQAHPHAVLVLAGNDEQGLLARLMEKVAALNLQKRVLAPGLVSGQRKIDLLARADVFVLPSIGEGLSMAALEALASGTPAVLSRECNLPIVGEVGAGAVVNRTPEDFARAISRLLSNPELRRESADSAYRLARDHFSWSPILNRLEDIYSRATAEMKAPVTSPRPQC
jgi:glycosyltransferase involved in cell wall biosynthesis